MEELPKSFFAQDTVDVAKDLLGKIICVNGYISRIVETEAYKEGDPAAHCYKRTPRSNLMFDTHGHVYVYLIYGVYNCINFTTDENRGGAVLIRAVEPLNNFDKLVEKRKTNNKRNLCSGPGKLCQAFSIDKSLNGLELGEEVKVFDDGYKIETVGTSSRIGITKATDLQWRFFIDGSEFVSK